MIGVSAGRLRAYLRAGVLSPERGDARRAAVLVPGSAAAAQGRGAGQPAHLPPPGAPRAQEAARAALRRAPADRRVARHRGPGGDRPRGGRALAGGVGAGPARVRGGPPRRPRGADARSGCCRPGASGSRARPGGPDVVPLTRRRDLRARLRGRRDRHRARRGLLPPGARAGPRSTRTRTSTSGASCTSARSSAAAEAHYRQALAIRPQDPTASFNLGVALEDQGRHAEALDAYQRAIATDGRNADAHYNAARLYDLLGDYGAALRHLRICRDLARRDR